MTECAVGAGIFRPMAAQASAHRNVRLAGKLVALRGFSVTVFAAIAGPDVRPVAERHVVGDLVHPHPRNRPLAVEVTCQFSDGRAVGLDGGMALHARGRGRDALRLAGVGVGVTHFARHFQRAGVGFVTEWQRLFGRVGGGRHEDRCQREKSYRSTTDHGFMTATISRHVFDAAAVCCYNRFSGPVLRNR